MEIYWGLFSTIILIQLIPSNTDTGNNSKLIISFLLMFCYSALRGDFANDYSSYEKMFYEVKNSNLKEIYEINIEYGYLLLNKIMPTYRALLVTLTAFMCFTYYFIFSKFIPPRYYILGFILLAFMGDKMLFFQMTGLRNSIAINIMTLSIPLIAERKLIQYIGLIALAFFFHNSIVFFMPLTYFIASPHKFKIIDLAIWSFILIILLTISATSLIDTITPFMNQYFFKYTSYIDAAQSYSYDKSNLLFGFVILFFVISFIILFKKKLFEIENTIIKLSLLFVISLLLGSLNFRMSQYYAPYFILSTIVVISRINEPILKFSYLGIVFLYLWYSFFIVCLHDPYFSFKEYYTIFN